MTRTDQPDPANTPPRPMPARLEAERRRIVQDYADDLREIIRKLRQRLH